MFLECLWNRCLEPSSPSVGRKSSFSAASPIPLDRQEFLPLDRQEFEGEFEERLEEGAKRQRGEVSVETSGDGCWMPDLAQFVQKRIKVEVFSENVLCLCLKVEGVGIKMVQDLTMDDFLRLVLPCKTVLLQFTILNPQKRKKSNLFCITVHYFWMLLSVITQKIVPINLIFNKLSEVDFVPTDSHSFTKIKAPVPLNFDWWLLWKVKSSFTKCYSKFSINARVEEHPWNI